MKILIRFIVLACLFTTTAYAQCVPDTSITHNDPGVYPDSATNLPHAIVGIPYSTVIQIKVLTDTTVIIPPFPIPVPVTIDSILATNVSGFPPGFYYTCTPSSCTFLGGSDACLLIEGPAPTAGQAGQIYPIHVSLMIYGHITGSGTVVSDSGNVDYYFIQVDPNTGISQLNHDHFEVQQNKPNPFSDFSVIEYYSPASSNVDLKVSNMLGKTVYSRSYQSQRGLNRITLQAGDLTPGVYFYSLGIGKTSVTKRMIVDSQ